MRFPVLVEVRLRPGIADPPGATIQRALPGPRLRRRGGGPGGQGHPLHRRGGRRPPAAQVDELCQRLLANPVIEDTGVGGRAHGPMTHGRRGRVPGLELRARRGRGPARPGRRGRAAVARRHGRRRRRRRRAARRVRPRRLSPPRRHRPFQPHHGVDYRIRRRRRARGRHLQRLPGAHGSRPASRRAPEEQRRPIPLCADRPGRRERTIRAHLRRHGRRRPAPSHQPLRGQLHLLGRDSAPNCGPRTGSSSAMSRTRTARSTTSPACAPPVATSSASCPIPSGRATRSSAPTTAAASWAPCSPPPAASRPVRA